MTVKFSNLQYGVLQQFPSSGEMPVEEFNRLDQRITGSLGRRAVPFIVRSGPDKIALTREGKEARRMMAESDVFRTQERLRLVGESLAHCFDRINRKAVSQISQRNLHSEVA